MPATIPKDERNQTMISFQCPAALRADAVALAQERDQALSELMRAALVEHLTPRGTAGRRLAEVKAEEVSVK